MPVPDGHAHVCTWPRVVTPSTNCPSSWVSWTGPCADRHDVLGAGCLGSSVEAQEAKIRGRKTCTCPQVRPCALGKA